MKYPEIEGTEKLGANLYRILFDTEDSDLTSIKEIAKNIEEKGYRIESIMETTMKPSNLFQMFFTIKLE